MSGHSKWATIKRKKGEIDANRSKIFQKLAKEIYVAAKAGDKDPKNNPNLRMVIDKARGENMPKDNIQKAIDKASSNVSGDEFEEVRYEGYGPCGVAFMIDCLTDNKNRTAPLIRSILSKSGGNLGTDGSVSFMFNRKGIIIIPNTYNEEEIMMLVLDAGAEDFVATDDSYEIYTTPNDFINVKDVLDNFGISDYIMSEVTFVATNEMELSDNDKERVYKLINTLEDIDDVSSIYHNMSE